MVFQVTQCPHCESTFNTDPRILNMAAGKVRCGACLTVFRAEENLVSVAADDGAETEQESVFIGHDPADFFDPSRFLTRGSLSAEDTEPFAPADEISTPREPSASDTEPLAFENEPSAFEKVPSAFENEPSTLESEQSAFDREPSAPEQEPSDTASEPPALEDEPAATESVASVIDTYSPVMTIEPSIVETGSASITTSAWETEPEASPTDPASVGTSPPTSTIEFSEPSSERETVSAEEDDEHLEFFTAVDESLDQFDDSDDLAELEKIAALDPADDMQAQLIENFEQSEPEDESRTISHPEDISLSVSFSVELGKETKSELVSDAEPGLEPQASAETTGISRPEQAEDDYLEALVRQAIEEQDFVAAIEAGMQDPTADPIEAAKPNDVSEETSADSEWVAAAQTVEAEELDEPIPSAPEQDLNAEEAMPSLEPSAPAGENAETVESEVDTSTEAIRARALKQELKDEDALDAIPKAHLSSLERIITPVELSSSRQKSWGRRLGALTLILFLASTLAAQYLWRHRDNYSTDPRFRSAYEFACTQLNAIAQSECNLPVYSEIQAIRSNNLDVRSHPVREDGLMVTVEIRNMASFPQPFPILILGFNGANNQVIALREFAPEEYLEPGLRDIEFMPVASPVQISLPIMDPGDDAVNYTLAFRER